MKIITIHFRIGHLRFYYHAIILFSLNTKHHYFSYLSIMLICKLNIYFYIYYHNNKPIRNSGYTEVCTQSCTKVFEECDNVRVEYYLFYVKVSLFIFFHFVVSI